MTPAIPPLDSTQSHRPRTGSNDEGVVPVAQDEVEATTSHTTIADRRILIVMAYYTIDPAKL